MVRPWLIVSVAMITFGLLAGQARAQAPLAEQYLIEGKLAEGEKALLEHLKQKPGDDQARFGLGAIQVLQTFEHLGGSLHKYGLRTETAFNFVPPWVRKAFPQNTNPDNISYADARQIVQTFVDDLNKAEQTLALVKDPNVKLPLHVGRFRIDLFGQKKPLPVAALWNPLVFALPEKVVNDFVIGFDRGDASWLRGYCNFLAAGGEIVLAVDSKQLFESGAHFVFERPNVPHTFLQDELRKLDGINIFGSPNTFMDVVALIHQLRFPMKEPERMKKALHHLETVIAQGKEMWKHILAEQDDDNEWIPNPKQKGVLGINVSQKMVDDWLRVLDEADLILKGKRLLPFWRGKLNDMGINKELGINLNKVFTEPREIDLILWVQGSAATPYLQKGDITPLAGPQMLQKLNTTFGGPNIFGFAFWFN